jgi:hypothetical protein
VFFLWVAPLVQLLKVNFKLTEVIVSRVLPRTYNMRILSLLIALFSLTANATERSNVVSIQASSDENWVTQCRQGIEVATSSFEKKGLSLEKPLQLKIESVKIDAGADTLYFLSAKGLKQLTIRLLPDDVFIPNYKIDFKMRCKEATKTYLSQAIRAEKKSERKSVATMIKTISNANDVVVERYKPNTIFEGTIKNIDGDRYTIEDPEGNHRQFQLTEDTQSKLRVGETMKIFTNEKGFARSVQ